VDLDNGSEVTVDLRTEAVAVAFVPATCTVSRTRYDEIGGVLKESGARRTVIVIIDEYDTAEIYRLVFSRDLPVLWRPDVKDPSVVVRAVPSFAVSRGDGSRLDLSVGLRTGERTDLGALSPN